MDALQAKSRGRFSDAELDDDVRMKLIQEVHKRPCLWQLTDIDYMNREKKNQAKAEVVEAFGNKFAEEYLFRTWKNLQDSWRRIYKKQHSRKSAGVEVEDDYPPWPFYKAMKFMETAGGRRRDGTKYTQLGLPPEEREARLKAGTSESAPKRRVPNKRPLRRFKLDPETIVTASEEAEFCRPQETYVSEQYVDPTRYDEFSHIGHQVSVILREMNRVNQVFTCRRVCELQHWIYQQKEAMLTGREAVDEVPESGT
ncbi:hypothetical protein AAVH_01821 [Aphelenchoides avenae]|nr:hypothetical protein AAVH_01821 [Aphelenchus avenae]